MDVMVDCIRRSLTSSDLRAVEVAAWIVQRSSYNNAAAAALFSLPEDLLCAARRLDATARRNALVAIANVCFAYPEVQEKFRSLNAASAVKKPLPVASNVGVSAAAADATAKAASMQRTTCTSRTTPRPSSCMLAFTAGPLRFCSLPMPSRPPRGHAATCSAAPSTSPPSRRQ